MLVAVKFASGPAGSLSALVAMVAENLVLFVPAGVLFVLLVIVAIRELRRF